MAALGVSDFDEIKKRGIIVGHDNRFLGPEFAQRGYRTPPKRGNQDMVCRRGSDPCIFSGDRDASCRMLD